ncbi:MAG: hypothetical protein JXO44_14910, partial [Clostridia bacterium]|nr:hypothetical protein [Clostridia bacterium]
AVIKSELEQLREQSEELKRTLIANATGKDRKIVEELKAVENREKELMEQLRAVNQGVKDRSPAITQNTGKNRTEVKLDNVKGKGLLTTIVFLGAIKNEIDDALHKGRLSGELSKKQINRYMRDREKAVKGINELQRRAVVEPDLLASALSESFSKRYNIAIDTKILKENIGEGGLNSKAINLILDNADHLSRTQRLKMRSELFDMNAGFTALSKGGIADSKYANSVSSLLGTIKESELFDIFKNNNDTYVSMDNMGDGMTHIRSMQGEVGRYIEKMDHLTSMISTENNSELKSKMREELSELVDLGKSFHDNNGINFSEYEEIVTKQAHSNNDLQTVNSAILQKSTELRRSM